MQLAKYILVTLVAAAASIPHGVSGAERDLAEAEAARVMNFVYEGKTRLAVDYLQGISASCEGRPLFLLVKARVEREMLTVDDENKVQVEDDAQAIHRDLDRVIEYCSSRIESGDRDPKLRLYRGLAWMSKSHLCAFAQRFWRAGRDAKKGKSDLDAYLETNPEDPLAIGTLGVFLYFADTIPTAFKYLSKLLLMPTGDRGKGLQFIEYAASHPGFMRPEFEAILGNVYLLFEGRFEDGLRATVELAERYPANPRIAMPLALMLPFDPAGVARQTRRVEDTIERVDLTPQDMPERYALTLLEFLVAYADRFIATTDVAAAKLGRIADLNPKHPDWVGGYAGFELGRLMASLGEVSEARTAFDWVTHNPRAGYLHEDAKRLSHALRDIDRSANIPQSMWVREIYYGSAEDRRNAVEAITASAATPASEFYLGEASLLGGNLDEALASYENVVASRVDPWAEEFQMLASCRIAEIHGARGDYDGASQWLGKATEYYQKEFLVDWLLEGRRLFYERLRDGKSQAGPQAGPYILTGAP